MTQLRKISLSRRDFLQDDRVRVYGGAWESELPLTNILDMNPMIVAQAVTNLDIGATVFICDLGYQRNNVGLFWFANLRTSMLGFLDIWAGNDSTFGSFDYHFSGSSWPKDKDEGSVGPWGDWTLNGVYDQEEYARIGFSRFILPAAPLSVRYVKVLIRDICALLPLQIGCFGVSELYESPNDFGPAPQITIMDKSSIQRSTFGGAFLDRRKIGRRFNFGFPAFERDEMLKKTLGLSLIKGQSQPLVALTFPSDGESLEKMGVYGLVSNDGVLNNPFFGLWAQPIQIDEL